MLGMSGARTHNHYCQSSTLSTAPLNALFIRCYVYNDSKRRQHSNKSSRETRHFQIKGSRYFSSKPGFPYLFDPISRYWTFGDPMHLSLARSGWQFCWFICVNYCWYYMYDDFRFSCVRDVFLLNLPSDSFARYGLAVSETLFWTLLVKPNRFYRVFLDHFKVTHRWQIHNIFWNTFSHCVNAIRHSMIHVSSNITARHVSD